MHKGIIIFFKCQIRLKCAQNNWPDYRILGDRGSGNGSDTMIIGKMATRRYKSIYDSRVSFWGYKHKRDKEQHPPVICWQVATEPLRRIPVSLLHHQPRLLCIPPPTAGLCFRVLILSELPWFCCQDWWHHTQ